MPSFPHTKILLGPTCTIDVSGPHVQLIDSATGAVQFSTATLGDEQKNALVKSGPIRCAAVDEAFARLVTCGEDKMLKVWDIEKDSPNIKLFNQRELPKKPTGLTFTKDGQTILVSDKFGDVFSYPLHFDPSSAAQKAKRERDSLSSHENPSDGTLVLGHASPVNAFILSQDEKFIITADRDEHIRISWFPRGYVIEMYCLGHLKFVSAVHIPSYHPELLISGGGDPMLKIWDWMTGKLKHEVEVWSTVEPFVVAYPAEKRKRAVGDDDDDAEGGKGGRRAKGQKGKDKERQSTEEEEVEPSASENTGAKESREMDENPEKVLVIHTIGSVQEGDQKYVLFSAVGSTALFMFPLQDQVSKAEVTTLDFGRPVLDFSVLNDGDIMVILDGEWTADSSAHVSLVKIASGKLVEDKTSRKGLLGALNSTCLLPATADELKKLDLYHDLTAMPKHSSDPEAAAVDGDTTVPVGAPELSSSSVARRGKAKRREGSETQSEAPSRKELGKLKARQAVKQARQQIHGEDGGGQDEAPKVKKARSERSEMDQDVVMAEGSPSGSL